MNALTQDVISDAEGFDHRGALVEHFEQPVVGDDDQRVDLFAHRVDPERCSRRATCSLKAERARDDADRQCAYLSRYASDDRRGAGACAATGSGGDEDHVGTLQQMLDAVVIFHRSGAAELRVGACAEPTSQRLTDMNGYVGLSLLDRLNVGVYGDEFDASDASFDHPVDGVYAGSTYADYAQYRAALLGLRRTVRSRIWRRRHQRRLNYRCVKNVVRDLRAEGAAQALLRRRCDARLRLAAGLGLGLIGAGSLRWLSGLAFRLALLGAAEKFR